LRAGFFISSNPPKKETAMPIEYKTFAAEVKKFDDDNLIVEHFISTEHKDRGGDIMRAKGMKIVGKPVVLLLHGRGPMGSEPVAKPLSIEVDEFKGQPGILAKTQFFPDEVGNRLYQKVKGNFFPNWSIGYSVDEARDLLREGKYDGRDVTKWQLLEYSLVGVPMNPFAQTIKEFLDKKESGEGFGQDTSNPRWFGFVDVKECKGCGQGCTKHKPEECVTCKAEVVVFWKDGVEIGKACEKCQPEEFARLQKEVAPPDPPTEEEKSHTIEIRVTGLEEAIASMNEAIKTMTDTYKKLEPHLATLPPDPDGGEKGKEGDPNNPPEKKTPPRLVIVRDEDSPEAKARAAAIAIAKEAIGEVVKQEIDRMKGRVP
jgi:predicted transcriptional regulator